jgi:hypothetical protein
MKAIQAFAISNGLRVVSITQRNNPWRYWVRGQVLLSNLTRIFVLVAEVPGGSLREVHVAFDPLAKRKGLQVLLEKSIRSTTNL